MKKRILAFLLSVLMIVSMLPASVFAQAELSADKLTLELTSADIKFNAQTVTLELKVSNNPGFAGASFEVEFDDEVFTLSGAEAGPASAGLLFTNPMDSGKTSSPVGMTFFNTSDVTADGVFATLTFDVDTNKVEAGDYEFTIVSNEESVSTQNFKYLEHDTVNGVVTVAEPNPDEVFTFSASDAQVRAGDEEVEIDISVKNSPGFAGATFEVEFDDEAFTLSGAEAGPAATGFLFTNPMDSGKTTSPVGMTFFNTSDITADGVLATLTFTINWDAIEIADYDFTIVSAEDSVSNQKFEELRHFTDDGVVTVIGETFSKYIKLNSSTVTYDGEVHNLELAGEKYLPENYTVEYTCDGEAFDGAVDAGTYNIEAVLKAPGYNKKTFNATLTIAPKALTYTGKVASREYDGTTNVSFTTNEVSGIVEGDDVTVDINAQMASADVAKSVAVNVSFDMYGDDAGNYTLPKTPSLKAAITAREITVTANGSKKVGEEDPVLEPEIVSGSLVEGDKFTGAIARDAGEEPGVYATKQGTLKLSSNYKLTFTAGEFEIIDREPQNFKAYITIGDNDGVDTVEYGSDDDIGITLWCKAPECVPDAIKKAVITSSNDDVVTFEEFAPQNILITGAGEAVITVYVPGDDTYAPVEIKLPITVTKRALTITADNKTMKAGNEVPEFTYTLDGTTAAGDSLNVNLWFEGGEDIGEYEIYVDYEIENADSYDVTVNNGILSIIDKLPQENISISDIPESLTYGDDGFTVGVLTNDGAELIGEVTLTSSNPDVLAVDGFDVDVKNAGKATLTITAKGDADYADFVYTNEITVNKRALTVEADSALKYVGQDDPEFTYVITEGSLVEGDILTGALTRASGETAGKKYEIKLGTLTAGNNYEITFVKNYLSVLSKLDQQIDIEMVTDAIYGDYGFRYDFDSYTGGICNKDGEFTITSSNEDVAYVEGDSVYIKFAGKTNITVSVSGNYMFNDWSKTAVLTVAKRPLTITANDASKRVDGDDPEFSYEVVGEAAYGDTLEVTVSREAGEDIGTYDIVPSYTLTNADSYDVTVNNGTFTILDKYPQENISVTGIPQSVTYGDEGFTVGVETTDEAQFLGEVTLTSSNPDILGVDGFDVDVKNAGKATLTLTAKGNADYADYVYTKEITVNKRNITVSADEVFKYVGQQDPELTYTVTEGTLVEGDAITGALTRTKGETAGKKYEIKIGTLTAGDNYKLTYVKNYLNVLKKLDQNVVFTAPANATYKDADLVWGSDWGVSFGDDYNSEAVLSVVSSNENVAKIGENDALVITGAGKTILTATLEGNYMYNDWESKVTLTVAKKAFSITANDVSKKIGNEDPVLTYTLEGIEETDDLVVTLVREEGEALGEYDINVTYTMENAESYSITVNKGTFTIIDKLPQTITAPEKIELTYGDEAYTLEAVSDLEGAVVEYALENEDVVRLTQDNKLEIVGAGEATVTVTAAGNDDYADAEKEIKVTVLPKEVTVSIDAESNEIYYGGFFTYSIVYTGLAYGETQEDLETKAVIDLEYEVGTYTSYASGAESGNYTFTYLPFEYTVKPAELKISSISFYNREFEAEMDNKIQFIKFAIGVVNGVPEFFFDDFDFDIQAETKEEITGAGTYNVRFTVTITGKDAANYVMENDGKYGFDADEYTVEIMETYSAEELKEQLAEFLTNTIVQGSMSSFAIPQLPEGFEITVKEEITDGETVVIDRYGNRVSDVTGTFPVTFVITDNTDPENSVSTEMESTVTVNELSPVNVVVNAENGTVEGAGSYTILDDITLKATPDSGYKFSHWAVDGEKVSTDKTYTFKALDHMREGGFQIIFTAVFKKSGGGGGGGGGGASTTYYYVTFNTDDETSEKVKVEGGDKVAKPADPAKDGFVFEGWFTDVNFTTLYDFNKAVSKSFDLYAKWTEEKTDDGKTEDGKEDDKEDGKQDETEKWTNPFTDVKEDDWFYASVEYASNKGLFKGMTETTFGPSELLTRAMLVTVLYRAEGEPEVAEKADFTDVADEAYYAKAVAWAKANGIVNGMTVTEFAPDVNITREQIATIIFRYAAFKGMNAVTLEENLHFDDADTISPYAISALNWAVGSGLMKGRTETTINPRDNATRAEAATILMRYFTEIAQ